MIGFVKDLLVCDVKGHGVGKGLRGTEIARITRVRSTGDNDAHAVALATTVGCGPKFDVYVTGAVVQWAGAVGANADVAVADVRASAIWSDVAEDKKEIGVFEAGTEKQLRRHRANDFQAGGEGLGGEQQDIRAAF